MILLTAIRTIILDYCIETFYRKIKSNFSIHDESDIKYLKDCYNILVKIHDISGESVECTFEEYCLMYYESLNVMGSDYTNGTTSIFNKERLEYVYDKILESDGELSYSIEGGDEWEYADEDNLETD